jgi:hypothetical protein
MNIEVPMYHGCNVDGAAADLSCARAGGGAGKNEESDHWNVFHR